MIIGSPNKAAVAAYCCACSLEPTNRKRCKECGIDTGSRQPHPRIFLISSTSRPPVHKTTWLAATRSDPAQFRNLSNSPNALEQTKFTGVISSPSSSYRLTSTRVSVIASSRTTSAKKVAFFTLDSIKKTCNSGQITFNAKPGNPPPDPTSASRPPCSGTATAAYIDSQKCLYNISKGSRIAVILIFSFQARSSDMYR